MLSTKSTQTRSVEIDPLRGFLSSMGTITENLVYGPKSGEPLYHYTDLFGLIGIVKNHDLWLTHSRYSNDEEEMTLGYRIAQEVIANRRKGLTVSKNRERVTYLDALARRLAESSAAVYICCFCLTNNLLSQWRSYSANGNGVCLTFDWEQFNVVTGPDSPPGGLIRLWNVSYERVKQEKILNNAVEHAFSLSALTPEERAHQAADFIEFFVPTFKNQDFEQEQEYRLIFTPAPNYVEKLQFRVGRGMLIPYYSLKEISGSSAPPHLPIPRLLVGPSANKQLNYESVKMLLKYAGYTSTQVEMSNTPYRA